MVINSLKDGKSIHILYRDSKLTRILQNSLGENSRTILIINCSPSSYNDHETISTLRFGVRAKAIKDKSRINAELSPVELKQLLKKARIQVTIYEVYVSNLEGEVNSWQSGKTVPKEKWAPTLTADGITRARAEPRTQRPGTPSRLQEFGRSETPVDLNLGLVIDPVRQVSYLKKIGGRNFYEEKTNCKIRWLRKNPNYLLQREF